MSKLTLASALALSLIAPVATPASAADFGAFGQRLSSFFTWASGLFSAHAVSGGGGYGAWTEIDGNKTVRLCGSKCINSRQKDGWALTHAYAATGNRVTNLATGQSTITDRATALQMTADGHHGLGGAVVTNVKRH